MTSVHQGVRAADRVPHVLGVPDGDASAAVATPSPSPSPSPLPSPAPSPVSPVPAPTLAPTPATASASGGSSTHEPYQQVEEQEAPEVQSSSEPMGRLEASSELLALANESLPAADNLGTVLSNIDECLESLQAAAVATTPTKYQEHAPYTVSTTQSCSLTHLLACYAADPAKVQWHSRPLHSRPHHCTGFALR